MIDFPAQYGFGRGGRGGHVHFDGQQVQFFNEEKVMDVAAPHAVRYRHVVFPDSVGGYGRALNAAPRQSRVAAEAPGAHAGDAGEKGPVLSPEDDSFLAWLFHRAGLRRSAYKPQTLARRLPACLRAVRAASPAHARMMIRANPALTGPAVGALLIGVTGFFRDGPVFSALASRVLLPLLDDSQGRALSVWSVGCSDGAELYSVAMLLAEAGAGAAGRFDLLGTDCRPEAVARAAAGEFEPAAVAGVPRDLLERYFTFDGARFRACPALRRSARWNIADALDAQAPHAAAQSWDLILCRNLAIYLQPAAAAGLLARLAAALRPGGVLVLGKAERPLGVRLLIPEGPCAYRKGAE